jgi:outer membrane protein assembly factor BamB
MNKILSVLLFSAAAATASDWPQWRGPSRDGAVSSKDSTWPATVTKDNLKLRWSVDLAEGYSSPIVSGDRVFTVETKAKKDEIVRAFSRKDGKQLWETSWPGSMRVPFYAAKNGSWVRCTPATDGKSLFVGGMRDVLASIDVKTGKVNWRKDYPAEEKTPLPSFGFVSSPLLDSDNIYVQVGTSLRKIRKSDGKTLWQALGDERAMFGSAFSSPSRAKIGGVDQILVQTRSLLGGILPDSGKALWTTEVKAFRGMNILPPTAIGDQVFTATYGGGSFLFDVAKKDKTLVATQRWNDGKREGYMSSPVVIDGKVYLHGRDKRFHCLDPKTGKTLWSSDKKYGEYCSLVTQGKRILALDQRGILLLIEADPAEFRVISEMNLGTPPAWAHLAVCGDELYVRHLKGLQCYQWK